MYNYDKVINVFFINLLIILLMKLRLKQKILLMNCQQIYNNIIELVKVNPFITHKKLLIHLNDKFKLKINISKIKHILKHLSFTKKM